MSILSDNIVSWLVQVRCVVAEENLRVSWGECRTW